MILPLTTIFSSFKAVDELVLVHPRLAPGVIQIWLFQSHNYDKHQNKRNANEKDYLPVKIT
jgi:hypothetical protein